MIVDANILLYAVDELSPFHEAARTWLDGQLNGATRLGLPWPTLSAFQRIVTHPRVMATPMPPQRAWRTIESWLAVPSTWIPVETDRHAEVLGALIARYHVTGNLVPDAHLAALALEHGVGLASADTDFARFSEIRWVNPVAPG